MLIKTKSLPNLSITTTFARAEFSLEKLVQNVNFSAAYRSEDYRKLQELGTGNGGEVDKVFHVSSCGIFARKTITVHQDDETQHRQLARELEILKTCRSEYLTQCHGIFTDGLDIIVLLEYMDAGSAQDLFFRMGTFPERVLLQIAHAVLRGLLVLFENNKILHRDIKPSNILFSFDGKIKLCDFGCSIRTINEKAVTYIGTVSYMSPTRSQGKPYSIESDMWSLGATMFYLGTGMHAGLDGISEFETGLRCMTTINNL